MNIYIPKWGHKNGLFLVGSIPGPTQSALRAGPKSLSILFLFLIPSDEMDRTTAAIADLTRTHYLFFLPPFLAFGRPNKSSIDFFFFLIFSTSTLSFENFNSFLLKGTVLQLES